MSELISKQVAIEALKEIDQALWGIDIERSTVPEYIEHHEQIKTVRAIVKELIDKIKDETQWIPFKKRALTEEEKEMYPDWNWMLDCETPEDEEEIFVSDGKYTWVDIWDNGYFCRLESDKELDGCAWMSFPEPWKGEA